MLTKNPSLLFDSRHNKAYNSSVVFFFINIHTLHRTACLFDPRSDAAWTFVYLQFGVAAFTGPQVKSPSRPFASFWDKNTQSAEGLVSTSPRAPEIFCFTETPRDLKHSLLSSSNAAFVIICADHCHILQKHNLSKICWQHINTQKRENGKCSHVCRCINQNFDLLLSLFYFLLPASQHIHTRTHAPVRAHRKPQGFKKATPAFSLALFGGKTTIWGKMGVVQLPKLTSSLLTLACAHLYQQSKQMMFSCFAFFARRLQRVIPTKEDDGHLPME